MDRFFSKLLWCLLALFIGLTTTPGDSSAHAQRSEPALELLDGDRVVFLGDGLIEQEQYFGWVELMMTTAYPDRDVIFRNLGWSGDTPSGASRFGLSLLQAGREPDEEGWKQLQNQLEDARPTLLILGYGMASALEGGQDGLDTFSAEYDRLIQTVKERMPKVRFVCLSPISQLDADQAKKEILENYAERIRRIASRNNAPFVNLLDTGLSAELRKDSIHLNDAGYREMAITVGESLSLPKSDWQASSYTELLRQTILRKNEWWFHRSRPANMAYVFGFRKHEQGQNAVEIPQYDPLIAAEEAKIAALRRLEPVRLEETEPRLQSKYAEFTEQPIPEFTAEDDLEITLWAQNPDLNKPIHMNFDPQGRLWVASSEAYPMIEVGQSPPDKIIVLEDTTGDGKADTSTVFADGLLIPTGIAPGEGGVYVAQSTDLLFLQDTDGDGKADTKRRVLSGFGTEDTHHNLHTLNWGPDGRLYMNQSIYTRTDAETPHGITRLKAGGGFRYDTHTMRMEIFFRGLVNSWGHQFDRFGQSFLTDGAGFAGIAYTFPGATFNPTPRARRQLDLISPGNWPKFASLEIIQGNSFPAEWQGSIITCDFRANRVTRFSLQEQDAGFVTKQEPDLVRTSAATFRPIDVKQGPDGAIYIADWSNPIINHGEVDFRDPRRDRWHGRIWRVTWKGAQPKNKVDLTKFSTGQLLETLKSEDRYTRDQARRVLIERAPDTRGVLSNWLSGQTAETTRLEGLWLAQALDIPELELLHELTSASNPQVRAAAARVLGCWCDPGAQPMPMLDEAVAMSRLSELVQDAHPRVRLEAIRALAKIGTADSANLALTALNAPTDRFIEHALSLTVNEAAEPLMASLEEAAGDRGPMAGGPQLEFVLTEVEPALASRYLSERLKRDPISRDGSGPWIELIGKVGTPMELKLLFDQAVSGGFDSTATARSLNALNAAQRLRKVRPQGDLQQIAQWLSSSEESVQQAAIELIGSWKLRNQWSAVAEIASDSNLASTSLRSAAIQAMGAIGGENAIAVLAEIASADTNPEIRRDAIANLASLDSQQAIAPLLENLRAADSEQIALELWRRVLDARGIGKRIASQLAAHALPEKALIAGLRAARDAGREEVELIDAIGSLLGTGTQQISAEQMQELTRLVASGDPHRGQLIYRRAELACVNCHSIGGVGGKVGPDMTSLGASAPVDYLVESLFVPNAKIKEGFHSLLVVTEGDQIYTGIEVENNDQELVLRDANNRLQRIPQADIIARRGGNSLMPVGVVDRLSQQEQIDLVSFLSQLGKPGDFDASQGGVARYFEIFAGTHRREQQGADKIIDGQTEGWQPLQTLVNGDVPKLILTEMTKQPINISLVHVYGRTNFEVASSGPVVLSLPCQAAMWIDGREVEGQVDAQGTRFTADLQTGHHRVVFRLDARDLPENLRLQSKDVVFANE